MFNKQAWGAAMFKYAHFSYQGDRIAWFFVNWATFKSMCDFFRYKLAQKYILAQ